MFLENDLPLIVKYSVASLGTIKLCLAPLYLVHKIEYNIYYKNNYYNNLNYNLQYY